MGQFFGSIYCWFEDFFGLVLADYMWGLASPAQTANLFIGIGLWMFGITFAMSVFFYYVVNHPQLNHWWGWSIFLIFNALINGILGWQWVLTDYYAGKMHTTCPLTNQEIPLDIGSSNCVCFGISNMILSVLVFFIISCIIKWWSTNVSAAPFVK